MNKPNIILIISDQHNASVMGSSGDAYVKTPNLDKLTKKSISFRNCYCASPLCVPSRTSFLTGQLPYKTGIYGNEQSLHSDHATIAHALTNAGYETVLSGRMHFTGDDQNHGFEKRLVGDLTPYYQGYDFMSDTFDDMYNAFIPGPAGFKKSGPGMTSIHHFDDDVITETIAYMNERRDERPLFMTIGLSAPHPPYICKKELYEYYEKVLPKESLNRSSYNTHPAIKDYMAMRKFSQMEEEDVNRIRAAYYGLVEYLDSNIGKIIEATKTVFDLDNTIIIYFSDHGDHIGRDKMIWKGTLLENSVKVPLIISSPNLCEDSVTVNDAVSLLDLTKTIIDMSGAEDLPSMDGDSLMPYLLNLEYKCEGRPVIAQVGSYPFKHVPSAMIRKDNYKLILHHGYEYASLYNLEKDPKEQNDLSKLIEYQDIKEELLAILAEKWDGEKVLISCKEALDHYTIINEWSHTTHYAKKENWKPGARRNYLEYENGQ